MEKSDNFAQDDITTDIGEVFFILWEKIHIIILTGIIFTLVAFVGSKFLITPQYDSVTKIFVISKQDNDTVTSSDLQVGALLTKDYIEMVKSRPVLEEVIKDLNLNMTTEKLASTITVVTPADTRIIKITVRNADPNLAKDIADKVREAASVQIQKVMNIDAVNTVEEANVPTKKASPNTIKNTVFGGIFGIFLAIVVIVLIFVFDDTIKTPEEVERYLELNVLASIPITKETKKNKKAKKTAMQKKRKIRGLK